MKKIKNILLILCLLSQVLPLSAQWKHEPTPNDTLQSVRVLDKGDLLMSIYAPEAKKVSVMGDIAMHEATRAENGVWFATVPGVKDGIYRYWFVVDGVRVYDPKGALSSETSALLEVNKGGTDFFAMKDVPHGAMAERYYQSKTLDTMRRLHVWTPAGYEKMSGKLPVLYLIHGGGDNDNAWPTVGAAALILDNLMAEGKMQPMVVVMPNGTIHTESLEGEVPLFAKDLMNDIIPFIEANYPVLTDKDHRALAGLSMGGLETLEVGLDHYHHFGYLWVLSSGWFATDTDNYAKKAVYLKKIAADFNKTVRQLYFTQGGPEDIAYKNGQAMLKLFDAAGIKYEYSEMPGGHTWYVWRHDLYNMAQQLFK